MRFRFELPDEGLTEADRFNEATLETARSSCISCTTSLQGTKLRVIFVSNVGERVSRTDVRAIGPWSFVEMATTTTFPVRGLSHLGDREFYFYLDLTRMSGSTWIFIETLRSENLCGEFYFEIGRFTL